jgi:hypothetical protein
MQHDDVCVYYCYATVAMDAHLTSSEGEGGSKLQGGGVGGGKKMAGQGQGQGKVSPRTSRQPSVFAFWRPEVNRATLKKQSS